MVTVKIAAFTNPVGFCFVAIGTGAGSWGWGDVYGCESWGKRVLWHCWPWVGTAEDGHSPEVLLEALPS